jgi:hypothetical protein
MSRKFHFEVFRDGGRFGFRVRFHHKDHFHYVVPGYESVKRVLEVHDVHNERIWEQPSPDDAADVVLKSDEYKPGSMRWHMEQQQAISGPRRSPAGRRR